MLIIPKPPVKLPEPPSVAIEASSLAEVVKALHGAPFKLAEQWGLNSRTYAKRIADPKTISVGELLALAPLVRLEPLDALAVISHQLGHKAPERAVALKGKTLGEIIGTGTAKMFRIFPELGLSGDYRTAAKRVENPDTLLLGELFTLAAKLKADPAALLRIIINQLRASPPPVRPKRGKPKRTDSAGAPEADASAAPAPPLS